MQPRTCLNRWRVIAAAWSKAALSPSYSYARVAYWAPSNKQARSISARSTTKHLMLWISYSLESVSALFTPSSPRSCALLAVLPDYAVVGLLHHAIGGLHLPRHELQQCGLARAIGRAMRESGSTPKSIFS